MNQRFLKIVMPVIGLVVGAGLTLVVIGALNKSNSGSSSNSLSSLFLRDICDCYVLVRDGTELVLIDSASGSTRNVLPAGASRSVPGRLSPSRSELLLPSDDGAGLWNINLQSTQSQVVYSPPGGKVVQDAIWTPDSNTIVVGLAESNNSTDQRVTSLAMLSRSSDRLTFGAPETVDAIGSGSFNLVAASADALVVVMATMRNDSPAYVSWNRATGNLSELDPQPVGGVYFVIRSGSNSGLLWFLEQQLKFLSLNNFVVQEYQLQAWSDGPVSVPTPSGSAVVYLKSDPAGEGGVLTLLELDTRQELLISTTPVRNPSGLVISKWSPDERVLVFQDQAYPAPTYLAVRLFKPNERPIVIRDQRLPPGAEIIDFIPKG